MLPKRGERLAGVKNNQNTFSAKKKRAKFKNSGCRTPKKANNYASDSVLILGSAVILQRFIYLDLVQDHVQRSFRYRCKIVNRVPKCK